MSVTASGDFEISDALSFGWDRFKANIGPLAITVLVVIIVEGLISTLARGQTGIVAFVYSIVSFCVGQIIAMGWVQISLNITDGRPAAVSDMWARLDLFLPYVGAAILFSIMVGFGLLILIVPGIYLALTFCFYGYGVIDRGLGTLEALQHSAALTRGRKWKLLGFWLILFGLNILGLIVFIIGVLVTAGVSLVAVGYVYRRLGGSAETAQARPPAAPQTP
jgi:uncharacterized membrane protein